MKVTIEYTVNVRQVMVDQSNSAGFPSTAIYNGGYKNVSIHEESKESKSINEGSLERGGGQQDDYNIYDQNEQI